MLIILLLHIKCLFIIVIKKVFITCLCAITISSCSTIEDGIRDNVEHYERLSRDQSVKKVDFSKHTNTVDGIRFLVANHPDQVINMNGEDFDARYNKLISYLKDNGYKIMVNDKLPLTATVIAEVNQPMPDMRYIGIAMEQDSKLQHTKYNIVYGGNEFKARQFYNNYKRTL